MKHCDNFDWLLKSRDNGPRESPCYIPYIPDIPHIPHIPEIPDIPHIPEIFDLGKFDLGIPEIPDILHIPHIPEIPDIPEIFDLGISSQTGFFLGGVFGTFFWVGFLAQHGPEPPSPILLVIILKPEYTYM